MKKLFTSIFYYTNLLLLLGAVWACDSGEEVKLPTYSAGAFVINEGKFGDSNGDITFYDQVSQKTAGPIFMNANGSFAGDVFQSLTFSGSNAYLVLNGSNKIEVVDNKTFAFEKTITDPQIDKPRYLEVIDGLGYLSVWGPYNESYDLVDSYILVLDMSSGSVVDKIDTDEGVENLLYNGEYLFATNYNFGHSSTLAIIDPSNRSLVDQIALVAGPKEMVIDANGKLWIICTGISYGDDAINGSLFRINPFNGEIEDSFDLPFNPSGDLDMSSDLQQLIFNDGNEVYKMDINADEVPALSWFTAADVVSAYGLDIDPATSDIYITDALNFATEGKVYIYGDDGELKNSFNTGISPTGVVFR